MENETNLIELVRASTRARSIRKVVFSSPRSADGPYSRVDVRPIFIDGSTHLQFKSQTATQQFHKNYGWQEAETELVRLATISFRNVHLTTTTHTIEAKYSKKGKCLLRQTQVETTVPGPVSEITNHNRTRNHLIQDGVVCPFLVETGVMSASGKVHASHSKKFKQINRFLEFILDVAEKLPKDRTLRVVDFGCGKSYLTFATHHLLTHVLQRSCHIVGLDRRADVVETCNRIVDRLSLSNLTFEVGDIAGYKPEKDVDVVISLHACDTATDFALAQAVLWNASVILAVPCCQHELYQHLQETALPPLTHFGIIRERFASMATDSLRTSLLSAVGYQTQLLEFIETEHTPKNLLIRAVLRKSQLGEGQVQADTALQEVASFAAQLGVPRLTLERQLIEQGSLKATEEAER
jgi:SAM-dependent methyltransferase